MASTPAKKSSKSTGPTWSRAGGGTARASGAKSPAAKSASRSAPRQSAGKSKASTRKAPANRTAFSPTLEIPAHVRREIVALALLVGAALFAVGLLAWTNRGAGDNAVSVMGGVLAQLFGVAA